MKNKLILASASPQRHQLLTDQNLVPDDIIPADIDETPGVKELPRVYVRRMALEKAQKIRIDHQDSYILAADTIVAMGRRIFQKPIDANESYEFLSLMSGRRHKVMGGLCLITPQGKEITRVIETIVQFKSLTHDEKTAYVLSKQWEGKGGGYAIQGMAAQFVSFISGSHSNIIGLSIYDTFALLKGNGYQL